MGSWIRNMSQHSATLRPDFSNVTYPTYTSMDPEKALDKLGEENNLASAFPTLSLLMTEEYKVYFDNPTNADAAKKAHEAGSRERAGYAICPMRLPMPALRSDSLRIKTNLS